MFKQNKHEENIYFENQEQSIIQSPNTKLIKPPEFQQISLEDSSQQQKNKYKINYADYKLKSNQLIKIKMIDIENKKQFLLSPIQKGYILQCTIKRNRSWLNIFFPIYNIFTSEGLHHLMTSKKRNANKTSNYLISCDQDDLDNKSVNYLGKLRSNFLGTQFNIYDNGTNPEKIEQNRQIRKLLGSVYYQSNIFKQKSPKKIEIYIPNPRKGQNNNNQIPKQDLKKLFLSMPEAVCAMRNKKPKFIQEQGSFALNFNGRVNKTSTKNFLIQGLDFPENCEQYIMLFGKSEDDIFNLDIKYPLSPFQAFAIALTAFDTKLAIQ